MQNQHVPILVFAQSGRFLAQSATQAGYRVWVADCFGDQDTLEVAERWQQLSSFATLSIDEILTVFSTLTQEENCRLVCGSGIESIYPFLRNLPSHIKLIGNTIDTIHQIKTPRLFFDLLRQQRIAYPETIFKKPKDTSGWLTKSASGLGGIHIQHSEISSYTADGDYYQRFITGLSGSALFLTNHQEGRIISVNRHYLAEEVHMPFRLGGIDSPWLLSTKHKDTLQQAMQTLILKTGLLGLNSLDFIISALDELLILEINPRLSTSAELIENKASLFRAHLNACQGKSLSIFNPSQRGYSSLQVIYAKLDSLIPNTIIWPQECCDLPVRGSLIRKNSPICTSLVRAQSKQQSTKIQSTIKQKIMDQIDKT